MLAMARALATNPAVLLIDELSMGLAPIVEELYAHVANIAREGLSIVIVEQFAHEIPASLTSRDHAPRPHPAVGSPPRSPRSP